MLSTTLDLLFKKLPVFTLCCFPLCVIATMVMYHCYYPESFNFNDLPWVLCGLAFYSGLLFLVKKVVNINKGNIIVFGSLLVANAIMLTTLLTFDTTVVSDYAQIYDAALAMNDGTYNVHNIPWHNYMQIYPYQTGMAVVESWSLSIFGNTLVPLKIFALICINATIYLTYIVAKKYTTKDIAYFAIALSATFYPVLSTVGQLTNCIVVIPLILIVLLSLKADSSWHKWALAGGIIAIINFLRPIGIILLGVAVVVLLSHLSKKCLKHRLLNLSAIYIAYFAIILPINYALNQADYIDGDITSLNLKYKKYVQGICANPEPLKMHDFSTREQFNDYQKIYLIDNLTHHSKESIVFVCKKMVRYVGDYDCRVEMTYNHDTNIWLKCPIRQFVMFGWGQYIMLIFFAIYGIIKNARYSRLNEITSFHIYFIFILYVYLLIEAFSGYRAEFYPILILFAALAGYKHSASSFTKQTTS